MLILKRATKKLCTFGCEFLLVSQPWSIVFNIYQKWSPGQGEHGDLGAALTLEETSCHCPTHGAEYLFYIMHLGKSGPLCQFVYNKLLTPPPFTLHPPPARWHPHLHLPRIDRVAALARERREQGEQEHQLASRDTPYAS